MIKIENTNVCGWEAAIRGMRNPLNSWNQSDSKINVLTGEYEIGEKDRGLMLRLIRAGTDHSKFMRMITVTCDVVAPLYFNKELDTYKVGTVRNSCSTMHKIHEKEFTVDDFSCEHLLNEGEVEWGEVIPMSLLETIIRTLNENRQLYIETKDKKYWWQLIQLLPSSYNQRYTWQTNYQVLSNIYNSRKDHKLDEWHTFCDWIECLPYSELITRKQ